MFLYSLRAGFDITAARHVFIRPREGLRRGGDRFAGGLSALLINSARPLADLSLTRVA